MAFARTPPPRSSLVPLLFAAVLASACSARRLQAETPPCQRCHGGDGLSAPPSSALGERSTSARAVGAHRRHLEAHDDAVRAPIACDECHVVPTRIEGHHADAVATVTFAGVLAGGRPTTRWNTETGRCENVYCHGETIAGGSAKDPLWTLVDGSQRTCGSCHGDPPPSHGAYTESWRCSRCHALTVRPRAAPTDPAVVDLASGTHIDGKVDAPAADSCISCHDAPPATGAHRAHAQPASPSTLSYGSLGATEDVSPGGGTHYEFGCGHCHPLDPALHFVDAGDDGLPDVVLAPPATPVAGDEIKARNDVAAAFDAAALTCSGVYCHSSGQERPAFVVTPAWTAAPGTLGCDGCHANPPRYASGGPGAERANSHLDLDDFGYESGHFVGMSGPSHGSKHGGGNPLFGNDPQQAASPITCQACHFESVEAAPGRFFFLDTTGNYRLDERPEVDPLRVTDASWRHTQCVTCHAPAREGSVLPLRHVNGLRDVVFDPRAALPAGFATGLPALAPPEPIRPYFVSNFLPQPDASGEIRFRLLDDSELRVTQAGTSRVFMTSLASAIYDPATKTCANVGCHVGRQSLVDAGIVGPLRWGQKFLWVSECNGCHNEAGPSLPP